MTCVEIMTCGEKGADRGSGRGPWTVHVSFNPEVECEARPNFEELGAFEASSSRYAEPEADGVTPVFRTLFNQYFIQLSKLTIAYTFF